MLRRNPSEHWIRFHSLPESKRYAETPEETKTVLLRANALANTCLGHKVPCWLVLPTFDSGDLHTATQNALIERHKAPFAFEHVERDGDDPQAEPVAWKFHACLLHWRDRAFDDLITLIANDEARALWMSATRGVVFAPYDGGCDLFASCAEEVTFLRESFPDWLSPHQERL